MDSDMEHEAAFLFISMAVVLMNNRRKRDASGHIRRWWVHPINELRDVEGAWPLLIERFRTEFPDKHNQCLRVSRECFDEILAYVKPSIEKRDTHLRKSIPAEQRLCVTLFYLSTGDSIRTLSMFFRMGESTIRSIVYETCKALWETMSTEHLAMPTTPEDWIKISTDFDRHWNFPHCLGAIDGKHCPVQAPPNSGSEFFNYKKHFSIVLMAICDASYKFTYVDIGTPGRWSDGGTFDCCSLNQEMSEGRLHIPPDATLPNSERLAPYVFIGDEAFPLKTWLMRPIPGRSMDSIQKKVYNYRLSRARRTIENAFGIMVSRWRCLRGSLIMMPENASSVVLACCVLHNFLRSKRCNHYCPPGYADAADSNGEIIEGGWRQENEHNNMQDITPTRHRNPAASASSVRDTFIDYLSNEGSLPWQVQHVNRV